MEKKNIDWSSLGFGYIKTDKRSVANYKDGAWDNGTLTEDDKVVINECAGVLQYAQTCFEGLKAYTTEDGHIVMFRPDLNAARMKDSCERLEMPVYPEDKWVEAVAKTVEANAAWVPPLVQVLHFMSVHICSEAIRLSELNQLMNISSEYLQLQ